MNRWIAFLAGLLLAAPCFALSVTFVNPGKSDEAYWVAVADSMKVAADSLGIELDVRYVERDHPRALAIVQEIANRPKAQRPDYLILTNDYDQGAKQLSLVEGSGIRCFFIVSSPGAAARKDVGAPRQRYPFWIGSLQPNAVDAGYFTAKSLIAKGRAEKAQSPDGKLHFLAVAGDRSTPSSVQRNEGMHRAVMEAGDVVLDQEVFANWSRDKAAEQSGVLFGRYPTARLVWAGSDQMAFGAMQAWEKRGGKPGADAWFSGINTSQEAMEAIQSGRLTALSGGHFIAGAWALVMIYDYANGRDFVDEGLELDRPMFTLFDAETAKRFQARFGSGYSKIDFRKFSKVLNPQLKKYNFSFEQLMR
jgi:ABC-type sugar transport system substrate-binding protein